MLPHAYAFEVINASMAVVTLLIKLWALRDRWRDCRAAAHETEEVRIIASGSFDGEFWRTALVVQLVIVACWAVIAAPPVDPGHFWSWEQFTTGRILFSTFIDLHAVVALIDIRTKQRTLSAMRNHMVG
jgi:hypothetical protein